MEQEGELAMGQGVCSCPLLGSTQQEWGLGHEARPWGMQEWQLLA